MQYKNIVSAEFIKRDNRFVARCLLDGREIRVHVKNTGRCRELLVPGAAVYLEDFRGRMGNRKMRWDLIAVDKETERGTLQINMDSQAPNRTAGEALQSGAIVLPGMGLPAVVRPEQVYGDSRLDFYLEDEDGAAAYLEVKGVTLESGSHARFPDAPTERGRKHLRELTRAVSEGFHAYVLFIIQMEGMVDFAPNDETDPAFGIALREAARRGVVPLAYECSVTPDSLTVSGQVPVINVLL